MIPHDASNESGSGAAGAPAASAPPAAAGAAGGSARMYPVTGSGSESAYTNEFFSASRLSASSASAGGGGPPGAAGAAAGGSHTSGTPATATPVSVSTRASAVYSASATSPVTTTVTREPAYAAPTSPAAGTSGHSPSTGPPHPSACSGTTAAPTAASVPGFPLSPRYTFTTRQELTSVVSTSSFSSAGRQGALYSYAGTGPSATRLRPRVGSSVHHSAAFGRPFVTIVTAAHVLRPASAWPSARATAARGTDTKSISCADIVAVFSRIPICILGT